VKRSSKTESFFNGNTKDVGNFKVKVEIIDTKESNQQVILDQTYGNMSVVHIKENLIAKGHFNRKKAKLPNLKEYIGFRELTHEDSVDDANFIAYQISGFLPFEFNLIFESQSLREELKENNLEQLPELSGQVFDSALQDCLDKFNNKFEEKFKLKEKNFSSAAINMAQSALSNLIGGIGFFTGQSMVKSFNNKEHVLYWNSNIYTAVPSRSFFPRGFLWDEGFHNILISEWDLEITKDIIGHWLDLMNVEGNDKNIMFSNHVLIYIIILIRMDS
jgi:mannosyl-oligosaccharide glucosidase